MEAKARKTAKTFELGEKLLCYHGPLLYEAKILKVDNKNENDILYFIHYNGWNKNYDEWVDSKRILKLNEKNLQLKDDLLKTAANKNNSSSPISSSSLTAPSTKISSVSKSKTILNSNSASSQSTTSTSSNNENNSRRRRFTNGDTSSNESEKSIETNEKATGSSKKFEIINPNQEFDQYLTKNEFKIIISNELKDILLDDWDFITHQNKLMILPVEKNILLILNEYVSSKNEADISLHEVIDDLKEYFNIMLGSQLLYKFERFQYIQILTDHPNKEMVEIYGLVHLLRLFAKLGGIISYAPLEETSLHQLIEHIHDILKFLEVKYKEYFNDSDYTLASPEYVRQAL